MRKEMTRRGISYNQDSQVSRGSFSINTMYFRKEGMVICNHELLVSPLSILQGKLAVLDCLLAYVKACTDDKVVLVSNYTQVKVFS